MSTIGFIKYGTTPTLTGAGATDKAPAKTPDAKPGLTIGLPPKPTYKTDAGREMSRVIAGAVASGVITSGETNILLAKLANVKTPAEVQDVHALLDDAVNGTLISNKNRARLHHAMTEKSLKVDNPDGDFMGFHAFTEAVNEDVFGFYPNHNGVELESIRAGQNNVVTKYEVGLLKAELGKINDSWGLERAFSALSSIVNGNTITSADRRELAGAYSAAAKRIGSGFRAVTRGLGEDIFGSQGFAAVNNLIAKATANGTMGRSEVFAIGREINKAMHPMQLKAAYEGLSKAVQNNLISLKDRQFLNRELADANKRLGGDVIPNAHIQLVGHDLLGGGALPLSKTEKAIARVTQDNVISKGNAKTIKAALDKISTAKEFKDAYPAIRRAVAQNLISREDRELLKGAVHDASMRVKTPLAVTKMVGEDIFGLRPKL